MFHHLYLALRSQIFMSIFTPLGNESQAELTIAYIKDNFLWILPTYLPVGRLFITEKLFTLTAEFWSFFITWHILRFLWFKSHKVDFTKLKRYAYWAVYWSLLLMRPRLVFPTCGITGGYGTLLSLCEVTLGVDSSQGPQDQRAMILPLSYPDNPHGLPTF